MTSTPQRLYYLDLAPDEHLPPCDTGGRPRSRVPKQCFCSEDLYTTQFFGTPNDAIEHFLFGPIDSDGAVAIRAVAAGDLQGTHSSFQHFFSYIDAQKMRTPKGLDWIRSRYGTLDQLNLMVEMDALRQMHCTMWMEAVREVVSAEDSDVKFIVTDHPVTVYNALCPPDAAQSRYPEDPPIELIGSQTIFPLGPNHCVILTNLEYAQDPTGADLLRVRQNPRHFGHTLARTDTWIRVRKLSRSEVTAINQILKSRARRYIAASEEDWLYPEHTGSPDWRAGATILLPPNDELWHFGGEVYVRYKDGSVSYRDAFGRTSSRDYLHKEASTDEPTSGKACRCGSGKSFQACCKDLSPEDRMPSDVYSMRERNLMFFRAIENIVGLSRGKSWEDVRRELSDEQVKEIHTAYMSLWPKETNLADLLPRPDSRVSRALYIGVVDPRTIHACVIGWLPYFDEILVLNPFTNAAFMRPEYSPVDSPAQYKEQTIKNIALLSALVPFIQMGMVHLVPDPIEFNDTFRERLWATAEERRDKIKLDPADLEFGTALGRDDLKRMLARLPDVALRRQIRESSPDIPNEKLNELIEYIRKEHVADPFALIQPLAEGKDNGQLLTMRGMNFELALFLAQLTGAAVYSDQVVTRDNLEAARLPPTDGSKTIDRTLPIVLTLDLNPDKSYTARANQPAQTFRVALRALQTATLAQGDSTNRPTMDTALGDVKNAASVIIQVEQESAAAVGDGGTRNTAIEVDAHLIIPSNGYGLTSVRRFLVAFGRRRHTNTTPFAILFGRAATAGRASASRS